VIRFDFRRRHFHAGCRYFSLSFSSLSFAISLPPPRFHDEDELFADIFAYCFHFQPRLPPPYWPPTLAFAAMRQPKMPPLIICFIST